MFFEGNILDKFNPGARQLISAGKAYLKALHGASAASNLFNEALAKIAVNAQQGGTIDIGSALMNIVGVYKEIQDQHMNILKAFYVDLLVPLETNLEKDTKVVQFEQKKFLQQHKMRSDSYSKAAATMKKYRKKNSKNTSKEAEKEIKSIQAFEEEKHKLDQFCEQSLKNAMTQERRRYGFVLERQCSLAKHWMAYHHSGHVIIEKSLDNWNDVAATREFLPPNVENMFSAKQALRDVDDEDDEDRESIASQLRKTRSIDASCLDMRSLGDVANSTLQMPRAKSEFNLNNNGTMGLGGGGGGHHHGHHTTMMMMAGGRGHDAASMIGGMSNGKPDISHWERPTVKALYAYLSSGENQLSFLEGDRIALVGDRAKGWQFGENLRTQKFGWFPIAYTETERDDKESISEWVKAPPSDIEIEHTPDTSLESTLVDDSLSKMTGSYHGGEDASPTRMFGDTIQYRQSKQFRRLSRGEKPPKPGPPPQLPAPVPTPVVPNSYNGSKQRHDGGGASGSGGGVPQSNSFSSSGAPPMADKRKSGSATMNFSKPPSSSNQKPKASRNGMASASLHSSNDSGFSNEPQPQPEADLYSDEEPVNRVPIRSARSEKNLLNDQTMTRSNGRDSSVPSPRYDDDDIYGTIVPPRPRHQSQMMRQANSYGNIAESNSGTLEYGYRSRNRATAEGQPNQSDSQKIKRTKSFWKFSKSEDHILEGMAMWKHNDIIPTGREKREMEKKEATLKRNMRKKEQLEKQKQKEMIAAKAEEEQQKEQKERRKENAARSNGGASANGMMMESDSNTSTLVRSNPRESRDRERDRDQQREPMRERPHSIAMMPEQEKFPITKSDIDKRISKIDQEFHHQHQKKSSRGGQDAEQDARGGRSGRDRDGDRKQSKGGGKNDSNNNSNANNRHSYAGDHGHRHHSHHHQEQELYGEAPMGGGGKQGKDGKYRTTDRETSRNRNNDALNKYYQDQTFDDFSIIPSDSIMMQDTSFYDDDGMMDDMMLMKTVRRKEILKQYYSSGTDTERNSSSSDPYDCIVVDDHLVATGGNGAGEMMMMRGGQRGGEAGGKRQEGRPDRKSNGDGMMRMMSTGDRRSEKKSMSEDKMAFSTFRGGASGGNGGGMGHHDDDDDTMMASMTLEDELMDDEPRQQQQQHQHQHQQQQMMTRDRRSKGSKMNGNGGNSGPQESKYESEQESRISAKVQNNGQQQKRKSTKSIASDGKAYGPWYDLWGTDSSVHNQKL
ncbi:AGAP001369-PA-like protein [Anopheles sinensis]|uniref:AGAP001369-PA-like protein n=1 Tax=Anopheles sinensis TaxID=74873 RepID=A0A084VT83_ANOSI|nr:AGAP001369-PA-like protein [Anopheles sinensis]